MPKRKGRSDRKKPEQKVTSDKLEQKEDLEGLDEKSASLDSEPSLEREADKEETKEIPKEKKGTDKTKIQRRGSKFDLMFDSETPLLRPEFLYKENEEKNDKLWSLMNTYQGTDLKSIQRSIVNHVEYTLAMTRFNFTNFGCYQATAFSVRDRLLEAWNDTNQYFTTHNVKRVYYLSLEFLLGRLMQNTLNNIDMEAKYKDALMDIGYNLEDLYTLEVDPALGNGGLGRLAA